MTAFAVLQSLLPSVRASIAWMHRAPGFLAFFVSCIACSAPPADAHKHWAFQPVRPVAVPSTGGSPWPQTEIDAFVLARLRASGLEPAPSADARTILRRLSFDLTGLPPSLEEVQVFGAEFARDRQTAVARQVDRLLASPAYGERWGRHWLDVARFSDTKGYVYGREERRFIHASAYRDWVINAFNSDLPYNRFLQLQIAADQVVAQDSPDLAALGFITIGRRFLGVTHDIIDDRIDVVTRTTLGLTVTCARCHDHKYDPIPTDDYYSLYGVFHGADDLPVALGEVRDSAARERLEAYHAKQAQRLAEANARLRARLADYLVAQLELQNYPEEGFEQILSDTDIIPHSVRRWRDFLRQSRNTRHPIFEAWHRLASIDPANPTQFTDLARAALAPILADPRFNHRVRLAFRNPISSMREAAARYGELFQAAEADYASASTNAPPAAIPIGVQELHEFLHSPDSPTTVPDSAIVNIEYFLPTPVCEELNKLRADVDRRWLEIGQPAALILRDRPAQPNPRVFRRGSPSQPAQEVPRQFLGILAGPNRRPFSQGSGRLELAHAITDPANPLTARVMVNRVWQHHFGKGLVDTPSDLGLRAQAPSHPELLDWLAQRFIADGWSLKALHRRILTSAVYQSAHRAGPESDPNHRLLSAFPGRRLDFEQVRDAMLAVSGELSLSLGGKPSELLDPGNRRRTVYALVDRQFLPGVLRTFDFANPDLHVAVRHETSVPQQGLFFLNGPFAAQRARELARTTRDLNSSERIRRLHLALFQRNPSDTELSAGLRFIQQAVTARSSDVKPAEPSPWTHGFGEYNDATGHLRSFKPLPHFTGTAWQGAESLPGGETGWAQLTATGGHPGNTRAIACIRRWTAPRGSTVSIAGTLIHEPTQGDGIRGFVISSRHGTLASATLHHGHAELAAQSVHVEAGDTLDFLVDIGGNLGYDQFLWNPVITSDSNTWEAARGFTGPTNVSQALDPWEQYAHVLLLTNEFAFVD